MLDRRPSPNLPLSRPARFAQGVERRSLVKTQSLIRRFKPILQKTSKLIAGWEKRLEGSRRRKAPEQLVDLAAKAEELVHKSRLVLLRGSNSLAEVLALLDEAETLVYRLNNNSRPGKLFARPLSNLSRLDALEILKEMQAVLKQTDFKADTLAAEGRKRLADFTKKTKTSREVTAKPVKESQPELISVFLGQIKGRGWKVTEPKPEEEIPRIDSLAVSHAEVERIWVGQNQLLPADLEFGVAEFPIIFVRESRLGENVKRALLGSNLGYQIHTVYGRYTAISGLLLIGLQRSLATVIDNGSLPNLSVLNDPKAMSKVNPKRLKTRLDLNRFGSILDVLANDHPGLKKISRKVSPVNPPVLVANHYYVPLLPMTLAQIPDFSLGEWQPLLQQP